MQNIPHYFSYIKFYQDGRVVKALDLSSNGRMSAWVRTPLLVALCWGRQSGSVCVLTCLTRPDCQHARVVQSSRVPTIGHKQNRRCSFLDSEQQKQGRVLTVHCSNSASKVFWLKLSESLLQFRSNQIHTTTYCHTTQDVFYLQSL